MGNRYILTIQDFGTRYLEALPLKKADAKTTCRKLVECFARFGFPKKLLTDNGSNFIAKVTKKMLTENGITHIRASPYHPQSNGMLERMHYVLKTVLEKEREGDTQWDQWLPEVLMAMRTVPSQATGFSPFELLFGREARTPITALKEKMVQQQSAPADIITYTTELASKMLQTQEVVEELDKKAKNASKRAYDKKAQEDPLAVGEEVLYMSPTGTEGLTAKWEGPCKIIKKPAPLTYLIEHPHGGKPILRHRNFLKRSSLHVDMAVITAAPAEEVDDDSQLEYWTNFSPGETTDEELLAAKGVRGLSEQQRKDILKLMKSYRTTFGEVPGNAKVEHFRIDTAEDGKPTAQYPRKLAYRWKDKVQQEIATLETLGIVQPSNSSWASPIVPVPKPDGNVRVCTNYKALNSITVPLIYPLPSMEEVLQEIAGAAYLTTLDLAKGFLQIPVAKEHQHKTAFVTPHGKWEYTRLPFGLRNAPAHFQMVMDRLLQGIPGSRAYIDDIVIYSDTWEEHIQSLTMTLAALARVGFKVKLSKCHFAGAVMNFLGLQVGKGRLTLQEAKVKAVAEYIRPNTKKGLRAFLGLANFYRRFVPQQATIVAPLTDATRKEAPERIAWTPQQQEAFRRVINILTSRPVLRAPDWQRQFVISTDASGVGIGAVLGQQFDDGLHPVGYWSRKLQPREANYSITEQEALAMVEGIKHFAFVSFGGRVCGSHRS